MGRREGGAVSVRSAVVDLAVFLDIVSKDGEVEVCGGEVILVLVILLVSVVTVIVIGIV